MDNHGYPPMREKSEPFTSHFSVSDYPIKEFPTEKPSHPHTVESLPWIQSPLKYSSGDDLYFHPREQASMIELFFDLFFVANLATFTSTHSIVDLDTLWAYLGFFTVIWFTWLQITMHDVRFAIDSFYERLCKAIQFCVFLGFALAGYNFEPWHQLIVYETLCFVLFLSRVLLTIQYAVVLVYVTNSNSKLVKPLIFIVSTFVVSSVTFLAMIIASHTGLSAKIYYIWYVMALLEAVAVLSISATWSSLGFGKTHLFERMGLLSMIVVGEGVIGVTKVVGKTMGADGPDIRAVQQAMAIIGILIFLWAIYFDNHPHEGQQLGTKLETFWVAIHFPLHLAFVGIAEGANQIAIAYKTWTYYRKFTDIATATCATPGITSQGLTSTLNSTISYFAFSKYTYSASIALDIEKSLLTLNNTVNPCAPLATT
ncbi:bacterial low temperature requirement A protein-domain-containing protein, partial [Rhexocercosporidium sp. MPI-PUGE-AT-0058]